MYIYYVCLSGDEQWFSHPNPFPGNLNFRIDYACCCTLTSTADFVSLARQPAVLQLFPRYSVDIFKCTNASELIKSQQESM